MASMPTHNGGGHFWGFRKVDRSNVFNILIYNLNNEDAATLFPYATSGTPYAKESKSANRGRL
jgi:hypothetical protein